MKNINYKQLKKYDIGKMPASTGYQQGSLASLSGISNNPGYDMSNDISTVNKSIIPTGVSSLGTATGNIYNLYINNTLSKTFVPATTTGSTLTTALSNGARLTGGATTAITYGNTAANATNGVTGMASLTPNVSITPGTISVVDSTGDAATTAASTGSSALSYVAGGLGAALGTYGIVNDVIGYGNRLSSNDIVNMSGKQTLSKYGVNYNTYGGTNTGLIKDYTHAQNMASGTSMTLNGLSTGASIGGMIGTSFGPVGTLIGAGIGGLAGGVGGLIGSIFGAKSRSETVDKNIENALIMLGGYNKQEESVAGSKGLRNQFNATHADKGKNVYDDGKPIAHKSTEKFVNNVLKKNLIHTERGVEYGIPQGLAEPREGLVSMTEPYTHYLGSLDPNVVEERKDKIPVGSNYDFGKLFILGNKNIFGKKDNPRYADLARLPLKQNEGINLKREAGLSTPEDEQTYMKNWNFLRRLGVMLQQESTGSLRADKGKKYKTTPFQEYNNDKLSKFDGGGALSPLWSFAQALPYNIATSVAANSQTPYALNGYQSNPYERSALDLYGRRRADYTNQILEQNNATRQQLYNINNAGGLSSGLRLGFKLSTMLKDAAAKNGIRTAQVQQQAQYDKDTADAMARFGLQDQQLALSAKMALIEQYAKAVGAKQHLQEQARKNWYTTSRQALQDWNTYNQYRSMLNLYDRQIGLDELKFQHQLDKEQNNRPIIIGNKKFSPQDFKLELPPEFNTNTSNNYWDNITNKVLGNIIKSQTPTEQQKSTNVTKRIPTDIVPGVSLYNPIYIPNTMLRIPNTMLRRDNIFDYIDSPRYSNVVFK